MGASSLFPKVKVAGSGIRSLDYGLLIHWEFSEPEYWVERLSVLRDLPNPVSMDRL